jgi:hypothetical protein
VAAVDIEDEFLVTIPFVVIGQDFFDAAGGLHHDPGLFIIVSGLQRDQAFGARGMGALPGFPALPAQHQQAHHHHLRGAQPALCAAG